MPYRLPVSLCSQCGDDAPLRCESCDDALCLRHAVSMSDNRCAECHHTFVSHLASIRSWMWRALGFAIASPLFPLIVGPLQSGWRHRMWVRGALPTGLAMLDALLMTVVVGFALGQVFLLLRRRYEALRFSPS